MLEERESETKNCIDILLTHIKIVFVCLCFILHSPHPGQLLYFQTNIVSRTFRIIYNMLNNEVILLGIIT